MTHTFFQKHGFNYIHTPVITISDCEGAGEMFQVTTLFSEADRLEHELKENPPPSATDLEATKFLVKEKGDKVSDLKATKLINQKLLLQYLNFGSLKIGS